MLLFFFSCWPKRYNIYCKFVKHICKFVFFVLPKRKEKKNSLKMNCDVIYGFHEAKEQQITVIWQLRRCRNYYIAISDKCV